jgi:hypothetical protein
VKLKTIRTADLYQDVAVEMLTGDKSTLIPEENTVLFERPVSDEVLRAIDNYNSGVKLNILQFTHIYKRRRSEMMLAKQAANR